MAEAAGPGDAFAIGDDAQYRPVAATGDLRVPVSGPEGTGLLACHASGPLGAPRRGPVVIAVHGALRDSDRYLADARHAARLAASDALIVAPQFLVGVDRADVDRADGALYWRVEGWKGGYPALGPTPLSSFGVMDSLLARLAPEAGPDPAVVVFGNSAENGRSRCRTPRTSTTGVTGSAAPPAMRTRTRGGAWSATSAATSRSCWASWTTTEPRCCSRHRLIRLTGVGHTAADVLAAERTREIVFADGRGQPRA